MNKTDMIQNYISSLDSINIETHANCTMEKEHPECPILIRKEYFGSHRLGMDVLQRLLVELDQYGYKGRIGLHHYSEPLMDKKILDKIKLCVKYCPNAKVNIYTNGELLTLELAERLMDEGVYWLQISAYSKSEYERLSQISDTLKIKYHDQKIVVTDQKLDGRISIYERSNVNLTSGCQMIHDLLIITNNGELQLCCYDYLKKYHFGNININTLTQILENSNFLEMRENLIKGYRSKYDICSRCSHSRMI
ncbi:MAG: SPASM domain-containing protein [gamma proteobacterium symbiont of Taylorina sp.]|nr:SPASM domain-containing protein [gamma proteobacterium symbiont of Taylorina sp.]